MLMHHSAVSQMGSLAAGLVTIPAASSVLATAQCTAECVSEPQPSQQLDGATDEQLRYSGPWRWLTHMLTGLRMKVV